MNSTDRTREFAPATKREIEAWNYRVDLEKQVKKKNKLNAKDLKRRKNHGT